MRISKATKTDVKASNSTSDYKQCLKDALVAKGYSKSYVEHQSTSTLEAWAKAAGIDIDNVCACGDIKASSDIRFSDYCDFVYQNSKLSREEAKDICVDCWNQGKSREEALEMAKTSSTKTDVKANKGYKDKRIREGAHKVAVAMRKALIANGHSEEEVNGLGLSDLKALCNREDIKFMDYVEFSTSTDKALQHIKAAIDILGKSGSKDAVTKDSIANLGVVLFDLKSKQ